LLPEEEPKVRKNNRTVDENGKLIFYVMWEDSIILFEGSQDSPICPSE
jgi:hypothetical protein